MEKKTLSRAKALFSFFLENHLRMRGFRFFLHPHDDNNCRRQKIFAELILNFFSFLTLFFSSLKSVEEKNDPDIIPHDNSDDEKDFERLYTPTQLNFVNRHSPSSNSPTLRFNEKQVRDFAE